VARILIVDDDPGIRTLVGAILGEGGHETDTAENGIKALEKIASETPDLVVLDVMMPRMDGFMVLKQMSIAGLRDATRVLLLTARTSEADWVRGYRLGADYFLSKPFDPDELTAAVQQLLALSSQELRRKREEELARSQILSRLESMFPN
jgi:DNA-binding response OmpR family regulator